MKIEKFAIFLANLNPAQGTEPGKIRPVVVVQTDLLNPTHLSTIVCPISTNVIQKAEILRIHIDLQRTGLERPSDILVDQIRALDNQRFIKRIGELSRKNRAQLLESLKILVME